MNIIRALHDMGAPEPVGAGVWTHDSGYLKAIWANGWLLEVVINPVTGGWDDLFITQLKEGATYVQIQRDGQFLPEAENLSDEGKNEVGNLLFSLIILEYSVW